MKPMSNPSLGGDSGSRLPPPIRRAYFRWWRRHIFKSTSYKQLENLIGPFENDLAVLEQQAVVKTSPWAEKAREKLQCARTALDYCQVQVAWGYFYEAEKLSIHLIEGKNVELRDRSLAIFDRAEEKLSGWRKNTVRHLIGKEDPKGSWALKPDPLEIDQVCTALQQVQDHYCDRYTELDQAQLQLGVLTLVGLVLSISLLAFFYYLPGELLVTATLFGGLGGTTSGIITGAVGQSQKDIPDDVLKTWVTIIRPIVGAMAALAIVMFLQAGIVSFGTLTNSLIFAVSFAAGFSERVLLGAVGKVSDGKAKS